MAYILGLLALFLLGLGVLEILSPKAMNAILRRLANQGVLKVLGAVINLIGALLLWFTAASLAEHGAASFVTVFATVVGVAAVLKGLWVLLLTSQTAKMCQWLSDKPDWLKRVHGIVAFIAGLLAFYAVVALGG